MTREEFNTEINYIEDLLNMGNVYIHQRYGLERPKKIKLEVNKTDEQLKNSKKTIYTAW